jgi:hypothetical protein
MANYNPTATETLGPEIVPLGTAAATISAAAHAAAMSVLSLGAETINAVKLHLAKVDVGGTFALDIYPITTAIGAYGSTPSGEGPFNSVTYVPNEDVTVTNITGAPTNTVGLRYQNLDGSGFIGPDYIRPTTNGVATTYEARVASAAFAWRPVTVTIRFVAEVTSPDVSEWFRVGLNIGGTVYDQGTADAVTVGLISGLQVASQEVMWAKNPATGLPWTAADIQSFDSTNEVLFTWNLGSPSTATWLHEFQMVVQYDTETRVATGSAVLTATAVPAWTSFTVAAIAGGNWSKANATTYLYVLRRVSNAGSLQWSGPAYYGNSPVANFAAYEPGHAYGCLNYAALNQPFGNKRWYGIIVRTSAPADSADSQVYADVVATSVGGGTTVTTEFSNAAAKNYAIIVIPVKYTVEPNQPMLVKIKRRSDNVQFGATVTLTVAEVDALPDLGNGWKRWQTQMGSVAGLAAATQYYVEFTSAATAGLWQVANLSTIGSGDALSFGGTTDRGTHLGTEQNYLDTAFTLSTLPATPAGFAVVLANQVVTSDASEGTASTIQYASISWTATALGVLFAQYEIQRTEDGGTTWHTIANIALEATVLFKDFEGKRGTLTGYRMRVYRVDAAFSSWTSTVNVTPAALASDYWTFVSNENNALNCIFLKIAGAEYMFPEADEVELHPIYGGDYYVALQPTEDRGVQVEIMVVMSSLSTFNQSTNPLGWALYTRLRALATDPSLSYVCVHDPYDNRLLAHLRVPTGPYPSPNVFWTALIRIAQLTSEFSTPAI